MNQKLIQLRSLLAEISDLNSAAALLGWDQQTYMPSGSAHGRGFQIGTVQSIAHKMFTSRKVGKLLDILQPLVEQLDPDSNDVRLVNFTRREFEKQTKIPAQYIAEFAQTAAASHQAWVEARAKKDFLQFLPYLEKIIEMRRRYANFFSPYEHIYDPLLDDFEPGFKTIDISQIFEQLRSEQTQLLKRFLEQPEPDADFLNEYYDEQKQWEFCEQIISKFGFDWQHGRMDKSIHPFTESIGHNDVRITTRINPNFINTALFGSMHEAGHALYELGIDASLARCPLGTGVSLAIHESQSRLWENLVGRSLPFWKYFFPRLKEIYPSQLDRVQVNSFYQAINRVRPSQVRIEADETTYNLHIILRFELETALMTGDLAANDLPEAWNSKMEELLGIRPTDVALGILQDTHWSEGLFGYFPTYTLGNLISAQLWEAIQADISDLSDQISSGDFTNLLGWLRQNIHQHGAKYEAQEIVQRATGSTINPSAYLRYLKDKYGEINNY